MSVASGEILGAANIKVDRKEGTMRVLLRVPSCHVFNRSMFVVELQALDEGPIAAARIDAMAVFFLVI